MPSIADAGADAVAATRWPTPDPGPAVERLARGGLVGFPTETLWGLAADAASASALDALRIWKGRADGHPISVLVSDPAHVERLGYALGGAGRRLAEAFWPGPLTLVAGPTSDATPFAPGIAREDGAVGFRCSPHPAAAALARAAADRGLGPPTATSLNRSGEPPAADRAEARAVCGTGDGPLLWPADGPDASGQGASTVVDVSRSRPRLLRDGAIPVARLAEVAGEPIHPATEEPSRR